MKSKTKKVAFLGLFISLAMILAYVESQIPVFTAMYGVKVGLPNIVMVLLLYKVGAKETVTVSIIRILLISMLFGSVQSLTFSIAGAVLSLLGMILLKRTNLFSCITVSIVGGILHNIGQIIAACLWTGTAEIAYYLPVLLISGILAGAVIGIIAGILVKRLEKWKL